MTILVKRVTDRGLALPVLLVAVLLVLVGIRNPSFFSSSGLGGAIVVAAPLILAAMAITPIAMAGRGGVDLSIGPLVGFINVLIVTRLAELGLTDPASVFIAAMAIGCLWQAAMAAIIIFVRVSPIIVSLAGFLILQGVNLLILPRPGGFAPDWLSDWGYGTSILSPVLAVLVVAGLAWWGFSRTPLFQAIRLTGADERMAYTCGVDIAAARLAAHLAAGVLAGLAAVCLTGLIGSGDPTQGNTLTLQAVTALVLGGTVLSGGRGSSLGSALGAVAMYLIFVVLSSFNFGALSGFMTQAAFGTILVLTLIAASFKRLRSASQ
jgi:ribose transport system permease protein